MPRGRFCKKCGYDLSGIASTLCPECSHGFSADDPRSYDTVPRSTRRRRLIRRVLIVIVALGLLAALFPRGYVQGTLTVAHSGPTSTQVVRTELIPPRWLARLVRYPGWSSSSEVPPQPGARSILFTARGVRFTLKGRQSMGGCSASGDATEIGLLTINGIDAQPGSADALFETVLPNIVNGRSFGVRTGTRRP